MSNELKEITFDYLNNIKYGNELKKELKELGVSEAWKGGAKKADIVNKALSLLAEIKLKGEDIVDDNDDIEEEEKVKEDIIESPEVDEAPKVTKKSTDKKCPYGYDKFDLETLLELKRKLESNIKNNQFNIPKILLLRNKAIDIVIEAKS